MQKTSINALAQILLAIMEHLSQEAIDHLLAGKPFTVEETEEGFAITLKPGDK